MYLEEQSLQQPQPIPEELFDDENKLNEKIEALKSTNYTVDPYGMDTSGFMCYEARKNEDVLYLRHRVVKVAYKGPLFGAEEINGYFEEHKDHRFSIEDFPQDRAFKIACLDCYTAYKLAYPEYCVQYENFSEITKQAFAKFFDEMINKPLIIVSNSVEE